MLSMSMDQMATFCNNDLPHVVASFQHYMDVAKVCDNHVWEFYRKYIFLHIFPSQQQDVDPTLVHGRHGWSNVAVGMPTFAPHWANVSNPTVWLIWLITSSILCLIFIFF